MKIAVFIKKTTLHKNHGGLEVQNKLLCEGLVKRGHQVTVFSPSAEITSNSSSERGVEYRFVDCDYRYLLSTSNKNSWYNKSYLAFKDEQRLSKFDLVISQSSGGIGIIERKNEIGIKVVSVAHGSALGEFKTYYINHSSLSNIFKLVLNFTYALRQFFGRQRQFILHSNKVIAVSNVVKKQIMDETFVPEYKVEVINNGIEKYELIDNPSTNTNKLVYVGKLTKDKGADLIFDILKDERFKDFTLDVAGEGELEQQLRFALTNPLNMVHTKFFGNLSQPQIIELFRQNYGAIFLFPTNRVEGFPMVLVEAMFAGLPVVAYDMGGVSDAVKDGQTGYLVKSGKRELFKKKTLELASDPVKIGLMSKNAIETAENNFEIGQMLDKYEKVFSEVLK